MKQPHGITIELTRDHVRTLEVQGRTERISWIHSPGGSVNILVSETFTAGRWTPPKLVATLYVDEGEEQIDALVNDYATRQDSRNHDWGPLPIRPMRKTDLRADPEIEADRPRALR